MRRKKIITAAAAVGILMVVICADCSSGGWTETGRTAAGQTAAGQTMAGQTTAGQTASDEDPEAAPESLSSKKITRSMEPLHADQLSVDYYSGGYPMIIVRSSGRYLMVPEGKSKPFGLPDGVVAIKQPLKNIYLAAISAMDLLYSLDGTDRITLSETDASGWHIEEAKSALRDGRMFYAGKYNVPDYERILSMSCDLAIESTMIYHSPKVEEQLGQLGIPVLVERSSHESHPFGRVEWLKLYVVLLGREEQVGRCSDDQARQLLLAMNQENAEKTVAFFYISSDGYVNARKSGDYVAEMITLTGGIYVPQGLAGNENALPTMNMQMESLYTAARDADHIIYNSIINGELDSLDQLLDKSSLLADFKAVKKGNVWCTEKNLPQETMGLGDMVPDIHRILTEKEPEGLRYMRRLRQRASENASLSDKDTWRSHGLSEKGVMPMSKGIYMKCSISFVLLAAMMCILFIWNINSGSVHLFVEGVGGIPLRRTGEDTSYHIVQDICLPRVLSAVILSGALSVSGFLLQTFFVNPTAEPLVLGAPSGVKLVVSLVMIVLLERGTPIGSAGMILAAFAGSMISTGFVLMVSGKAKKMSVPVICGIVISYICSVITDFVVTSADGANIVNLHNWSMGSFSGTSWENVRVTTAVIFLASLLVFLMAKSIGAYQMGEVYARNMGANTLRFRVALTLLSSILSACVIAFVGPVSFVGIMVPHLVKNLFRTAKPILMTSGCFLGGVVFCLLCGLAARTVFAPTEFSISSMTAVFGAPIVIYMVVHNRKSMQ